MASEPVAATNSPDDNRIAELIEASSFGTPAAKALRESVDEETAQRIVDRANQLRDTTQPAECICFPAEPANMGGPNPCCPQHGDPEQLRGRDTTQPTPVDGRVLCRHPEGGLLHYRGSNGYELTICTGCGIAAFDKAGAP